MGAFAAIGLVAPFFTLLSFLDAVINSGTIINYTYEIGGFKKERANEYFSQGILMALVSGALFSFVLFVIKPFFISDLGLTPSIGMYGTTVANAGDVFGRYPLAMGVFVTLSGFGSIITPSIIGTIAESTGIRFGMRVLLSPAVVLLVMAVFNRGTEGSVKKS